MNAVHLNRMGLEYKDRGQLRQAIECFQKAHQLDPYYTAPLCNMGAILQRAGRFDEAESLYRRALDLDAQCASAVANIAAIRRDQGDVEEARLLYVRLLELRDDDAVRFKRAAAMPVIYDSGEHVREMRRRLIHDVHSLSRDGVRIDPTEQRIDTLFYSAYQGYNDRSLMEDVSIVCSKGARDLASHRDRPDSDRIGVGLVSSHFNNHTIGWMWRGMIAELPRKRLRLTVFSTQEHKDAIGQAIRASAENYVVLPADLKQAQDRIAEEGCDLLLFTDIGLDARMYALATSRLARLQCVTWGHPVTTGLYRTMDMFVSSELLDDEESQNHYSERLVRLKTLGVYVERTPPPSVRCDRSDFGLPVDSHWYVFAQSLFKLHPDYDQMFAEILRRDPQGILALPHGDHPQWDARLLSRFDRIMPDVIDRVRFFPKLELPDYLSLTLEADTLLTCPSFGGGKTSYDAFSLGRPVVTMPSPFLRGRITYAMYRAMGVMDCVAEDQEQYVEIAVRLGTDNAFRESVREDIQLASGKLFEDCGAVAEMEDFLFRAGGGQYLPVSR